MNKKVDCRDFKAYDFAVILINDKIKDDVPVTEAVITEVVDECLSNSMIKDESKLHRQGIIDELMNRKYHALIKKHSRPIGVTLIDPEDHVPWTVQKDFYWQQLHYPFICESYASKDPENWADIVGSINDESDKILSLLEDPSREEFDSRGLVIGYVQSGKTANFTALISKALDSGYKLIVVLGGMHDSLRIQTQNRLNSQILGYDDVILQTKNLEPTIKEYYEKIALDRRPTRVTTSRYQQIGGVKVNMDGNGDFKQDDFLADILYPIEQYKTCVAVVKKNASILKRLKKWIDQCPEEARNDIPILIIDDEADQASVDANYIRNKKKLQKQTKGSINKSKLNDNATQINKLINGIIKSFKRSAYVGYTATPFANVFIDPHPSYKNLYPRNFIHILPKPEAYFGAKEIFGNDLIRDGYVITEGVEDKKTVQSSIAAGGFSESLEEAILSFLICMAIRIQRVEEGKAMSMLIHINHKNDDQESVFTAVEDRLQSLKKIINYKTKQGDNLRIELEKVYNNIRSKGNLINKLRNVPKRKFFSFKTILKSIENILSKDLIKLKKVNGESNDELDYEDDPSMKVIAIGGNKLSRGLTLEGLMVSYFLRDSNNADTLMQMGRFFGYRSGYNDVMKIYTTEQLAADFSELIECETLLRSEVERYVDEGKTPMDFAPKVTAFLNMKPSGKMGNAKINIRRFGASESQTFKFPLKKTKLLQSNIKETETFVDDVFDSGIKLESPKPFTKTGKKIKGKLFRKVPSSKVIDFLKNTDFGEYNFSQTEMIKYIEDGNIKHFNVGIPSSEDKKAILEDFGKIGKFNLVTRSRIDDEPINGYYSIGTLSEPNDRVMDLENKCVDDLDPYSRKVPLLLLYRVNKKSKKMETSDSRVDLFKGIGAKVNLQAISILMPQSNKPRSNHWVNRIEEE